MSECPSHTHIYINKHALTHSVRFCKGDVFLVTNADDTEWWQAKKIDAGASNPSTTCRTVVIPSSGWQERKELRKAKKVFIQQLCFTHTHTHTL